MKKIIPFLILALIFCMIPPGGSSANTAAIQLGSDVLFEQFHSLIEGKKVGLLTNQTGVNSQGTSTIDQLRRDRSVTLAALIAPEYGLDGKTPASQEVTPSIHPVYGIPVYDWNAAKKEPSDVFEHVDVLLVDLQDTGARTNPYITNLYDCLSAAAKQGKPVIVLDRPNPLGGQLVDGPVLEAPLRSSIGPDTLPLAHGMTIGELALFFNRNIGADLTVVPMQGYTRAMLYQETGLAWTPNAPQLGTLPAVFDSLATGIADGTSLLVADDFSWIGGEGIDANRFADALNASLLPGVVFLPDTRNGAGGVKLQIMNVHLYNPVKTGMYILAYARQLGHFPVPQSTDTEISLLDRTMGAAKISEALAQEKSPQDLEALYADQLAAFKELRKPYLIYGDEPYLPLLPIKSKAAAVPQAGAKGEANPVQPSDKPVQTGTKPAQPGTAPATPGAKPAQSGATPAPTAVKPAQPAAKPPAGKPAVKPPVAKPATDKVAYLTFDDGPSAVTPHVLDTLKKFGIKATFFIVGRNVPGHEAILKRTVAEGHAIGGHTYSHDYSIVYKTKEAFFADLEKGNQLIEKASGIKPTLFRYPGGSTNTVSHKYQDAKQYSLANPVMNAIKAEAANRHYIFIDWNVTNGDARSNKYTAASAIANIKQQVKNQKEIVILMHDSSTKSPTAQALPEIITFLKSKGYRFDVIRPDHPTVSTVK
ncbi:exo-beta-N-acetylmuramidase NamZ domain-containing protein [Brevibacillus sp. GCM10020057]|uniref:exo-beta-N-acetylmuramidase NamZ domain-containing protein n=1 Tax=Brevibacillus sp. GCM10020057 TaxID=3317327 RepID=UPI003635D45C